MLLNNLGSTPPMELYIAARHPPLVPFSTLLYGEKGTKRVLEYARLAMGFANVRASRYGIRSCSGGYSREC